VEYSDETEEKAQAYVQRLKESSASIKKVRQPRTPRHFRRGEVWLVTPPSLKSWLDPCQVHDVAQLEAAKAKTDWDGWFSLLMGASRTLQAKVDAGTAPDSVRLPEGSETPATHLLELLQSMVASLSALRARNRECTSTEESLEQKLKTTRSKAEAQVGALQAAERRAIAMEKATAISAPYVGGRGVLRRSAQTHV
jgi:hypothetical protein